MDHEQKKYLKERLRAVNYKKHDAASQEGPLPKTVVAAKRVMQSWAAKQRRIATARYARLERAYTKAYQAILFGDSAAALKALQEFEKFQP